MIEPKTDGGASKNIKIELDPYLTFANRYSNFKSRRQSLRLFYITMLTTKT
jgi:hypothetical protein